MTEPPYHGDNLHPPDDREPEEPSSEAAAEAREGPLPLDGLSRELADRIAELDFSDQEQSAADTGTSLPADHIGEHLEEIAEDMLKVMQQVRRIEEVQQKTMARVEQLESVWSDSVRNLAREVDVLRRDLLSDRKHTATQHLYGELIPMLERLRVMHEHLDPVNDERTVSQVGSVIESLSAALRRLGCTEFRVEPGEPFDPARMEALDYKDEGEPGVVLGAVRAGFYAGQVVIRPAGVIIADPRTAPAEETGEPADE